MAQAMLYTRSFEMKDSWYDLGGDLFVQVHSQRLRGGKKKEPVIHIKRSTQPSTVKGGRRVRARKLASLSVKQFKTLINLKDGVLKAVKTQLEESEQGKKTPKTEDLCQKLVETTPPPFFSEVGAEAMSVFASDKENKPKQEPTQTAPPFGDSGLKLDDIFHPLVETTPTQLVSEVCITKENNKSEMDCADGCAVSNTLGDAMAESGILPPNIHHAKEMPMCGFDLEEYLFGASSVEKGGSVIKTKKKSRKNKSSSNLPNQSTKQQGLEMGTEHDKPCDCLCCVFKRK